MLQPQTLETFEKISQWIYVPTTADECDQLVAVLDELLDIVRDDENHPLINLVDVLGTLIETYEARHIPEAANNPIAVLQHFMETENLKQSDLPEIGSQGVVSQILNGKRKLNLRQISALSKRFNVPPTVFIE